MKLFIILSLLLAQVKAADVSGPYTIFDSVTLTSAAEKLTLQQIIHGTTDIQLVAATMWCSVNTTFTLSINGTAASATTLAPTILNTWGPVPRATAWTASNVGTGTLVRNYHFVAGSTDIVIDLTGVVIPRTAGTAGNITLNTGSVTGTCTLYFMWNEVH